MSEPNKQIQQCPLAMDKWNDLVVGEHQILSGLKLITQCLSVSIMDSYLIEVRNIMCKTWYLGSHQFYVFEAQS